MKKLFFIANWKSHKTPQETEDWFETFARTIGTKQDHHEIIVCPPFPLLLLAKDLAKKHTPFVHIGAQDISYFPEGSYTGEVSGKLLGQEISHVIVGHSERRSYFSETDAILSQKVLMAQANMLSVIYCVSDKTQPIPMGTEMVAYEPLNAIGSGAPAEPSVVETIASSIKVKNGVSYILYGGSVTPENVSTFTNLPTISGVLVGGASLDPQDFAHIIQHA